MKKNIIWKVQWIFRIRSSIINYYNYHIIVINNLDKGFTYNKWCCLSDNSFTYNIDIDNFIINNNINYYDCITVKDDSIKIAYSVLNDIIQLPD